MMDVRAHDLTCVHDDTPGSRVVLVPSGELDVATIESLRQALQVTCRGAHDIAVDLSHVATADSTALGVLVTAHRQLRRHGRRLTLRRVPPEIAAVLQLTGLSKLFDVEPAAAPPPTTSPGQGRPG